LAGFVVKEKDMFTTKANVSKRSQLRVAHPTSDSLLFYATINDLCLQWQCGLDIFLLEYIAVKLNKEIRLACCLFEGG
jgi:hypothetical protein